MTAKEVVVGVDDSPSARAALRWAAQNAGLTGAVLRGIHVVDWPEAHDMYTYPGWPTTSTQTPARLRMPTASPTCGFSRKYTATPPRRKDPAGG